MRVGDSIRPLAESFWYCVFKRASAAIDRDDLCAQKFHAVDVQSLTTSILRPHENFALHIKKRGGSGGSDSVLTRASLGDQSSLAHFFSQQRLPQHIINFVRACVIQILAL